MFSLISVSSTDTSSECYTKDRFYKESRKDFALQAHLVCMDSG